MHRYFSRISLLDDWKRIRRMSRVVLAGRHNIMEFVHGYCDLYLICFLERNPDWRGVILIRKGTGRIIHAYAEKVLPNGMRMYADARGTCSDERLFFARYSYRPSECIREELTEERRMQCSKRIESLGLRPAIDQAYDMAH